MKARLCQQDGLTTYLLKELHIFSTRSALAKSQESMCSRWIVDNNVENLGAEEVGRIISIS
jgi:hypothetical protein